MVRSSTRFICLFVFSLMTMQCQQPASETPPSYEPAPLSLHWRVVSHLEIADAFTSELIIENTSPEALGSSGWTLYFNFIRMVDAASLPPSVRLTHINGDFFKLEPTDSFPTLAQGESVTIPMTGGFWAIKKSDAPAGFYMIYDGNETPMPVADYTVGAFETPAQTMRMPSDQIPVPTPASLYAENAQLSLLPPSELPPVVPTPQSVIAGDGTVTIDASTTILYAAGLSKEANHLASYLGKVLTQTPDVLEASTGNEDAIFLSIDQSIAPTTDIEGHYTLSISPANGIAIRGADPAGLFYGIQSLRAMLPPAAYTSPQSSIELQAVSIQDGPRFAYRGMHVDVARNFHTKESILKVLDLMGLYKLNKFHFHITDDEGWRLEIDGLPELTEIGGRRGHTLDESAHLYPSLGSGPNPYDSNGSGFYSRQDFIEILQFAQERHIEVIPEIDLPGHARAAIRAMEARYNQLAAANESNADQFRLIHPDDESQYQSVQLWNDNVVDVCLPSSYTFIEHVVDALVAMYEEAGLTLTTLHTGNDEVPPGVWSASPACEALGHDQPNVYFLEKLSDLLQTRNILLAGWEEIALANQFHDGSTSKEPNPAFVDNEFRPYVWNAVWGWGAEGTAYKLANAGYKIVMSNATNLYFDFAYDKSPEEPGFYWAGFSNTRKAFAFNPFDLYQNASVSLMGQPIDPTVTYQSYPRLTPEGRNNILGIQGQLWSESTKGAALLEYQIFPKLLGLAERAWAQPPDWFADEDATSRAQAEQAGWNIFANKIGQHELPRLSALHSIRYRIPPPGVTVRGNQVHANTAFPGLTIHYTTEDRPPIASDPLYTDPIEFTGGKLNFSTFAPNGRSSRVTSIGAD